VTFEPTKLYFDPGYSSIDASLVKRKNNDFILVLKKTFLAFILFE
jgi:hypothetical protein